VKTIWARAFFLEKLAGTKCPSFVYLRGSSQSFRLFVLVTCNFFSYNAPQLHKYRYIFHLESLSVTWLFFILTKTFKKRSECANRAHSSLHMYNWKRSFLNLISCVKFHDESVPYQTNVLCLRSGLFLGCYHFHGLPTLAPSSFCCMGFKGDGCMMGDLWINVTAFGWDDILPSVHYTRPSKSFFIQKSYHPIPCRDSISRPVARVSSVAGWDDTTSPRRHGRPSKSFVGKTSSCRMSCLWQKNSISEQAQNPSEHWRRHLIAFNYPRTDI
jgi:hypothetical protein